MAVDSFARLLLFKMLQEGSIPPSERTTSEEFNILVDKVSVIDNTLFVSGYDLMAVKIPVMRNRTLLRASTEPPTYVSQSEYQVLELKIQAIEAFLTVEDGQIMQTKETDGGDDIQPISLPHAEGEYVTKEEFDELSNHVDEVENMLTMTQDRVFAVRIGNE